MAAGNELHATVLEGRIFERKPETDAGLGLGVDVSRVLVADHFTADSRWLENIHGLKDQRVPEADTSRHIGECRRARERVEDGIEIVHRMSHLVEAVFFRLPQRAVIVERIFLEEKANLVPRFDEVAVVELRLLRCGKHAAYVGRIEGIHELGSPLPQPRAPPSSYRTRASISTRAWTR